jgi:hypothetical protein
MTDSVSSKPLIIADYLSDLWVRMIERNGAVAESALTKLRNGGYGLKEYLQSIGELVDGNLFDGIELAETIAAGPGFTVASNVVRSSPYAIGPPNDCAYRVKVTGPLTRGFGDELPAKAVSFEAVQGGDKKHCPTGLLVSGAEKFHILVDRTDLPSGSYAGQLHVMPAATGSADSSDTEPWNVTIEL